MAGNPFEKHFEVWVSDYAGAVWKIARAYTASPEECQDLTQEIFLQLWRSLPQFENRSSPATWVYRVALNTALGWHRKERGRQARHEPLVSMGDVPDPGAESSVAAAHHETVENLYVAIHKLKKPEAALVLLYLEGLSYRQMAEVLGISETNVGVKLTRAKKALSLFLAEPPIAGAAPAGLSSAASVRRGSPDPAETNDRRSPIDTGATP